LVVTKKVPQYYIPKENMTADNGFFVDGDEAHHIIDVRREKVGNTVKIFDGQGNKYLAQISDMDKKAKSVSGNIIEKINHSVSDIELTLCFAPVSRTSMETILDSCTQAGVRTFQPVITEFSDKKITDKWENKLKRWNTIVLSACKQCEVANIPTIKKPIDFDTALKTYSPGIVAWESEKEQSVDSALLFFATDNIKKFSLFIGPEGGFSNKEISLAKNHDYKIASLGKQILKAETAAIVGSGIILR
jgi:16S rRNA (uracil1498-N3)-methyltransferase